MKPHVVPTVGIVVFNDKDQVLLVEHLEGATHRTGVFGLPAGRIEDGEQSVDAAVRELEEETGLKTTKERVIFVKQYEAKIERKDGTKIMSWDVYLCKEYTGKVRGSMETKARWVGMYEISQVGELLPNVENAIQAAAEMV